MCPGGGKGGFATYNWLTMYSPPNQPVSLPQNLQDQWFLCNHSMLHALPCALTLESHATLESHRRQNRLVFPRLKYLLMSLIADMHLAGRDLLGNYYESADPQLIYLLPGLLESRVHAWAPRTLAGHQAAWNRFVVWSTASFNVMTYSMSLESWLVSAYQA